MRKSGGQPPGALLWYRWSATDKSGRTTATDLRHVLWLDKQHVWKSISHGNLVLHWYERPEQLASDLLDSASASLDRLVKTTGLQPRKPIDMYELIQTFAANR